MAITDLRKKFMAKGVFRGTQAILGERQHLQEVLRSVQHAKLAAARKRAEVRERVATVSAVLTVGLSAGIKYRSAT